MAGGLSERVVVVTGASSGIGKGTALDFAKAGAAVVLAARRGELLEEIVLKCEAAGGKALAAVTDVSAKEEVKRLAAAAVNGFGRIDVWVNNASSGVLGRFDEVPLGDHIHVIETDLLGTLYGTYFALQQFHKQGEGTLINVTSVIGKVPAPCFASYAAAKHGVVGLTGFMSARCFRPRWTRRFLSTRQTTLATSRSRSRRSTACRKWWTRSSRLP